MSEGDLATSPAVTPIRPDSGEEHLVHIWAVRLRAVGVVVRHVALFTDDTAMQIDWPQDAVPGLQARWPLLRAQVDAGRPVSLSPSQAEMPDALLALAVEGPNGRRGVAGVLLPPPCTDRTVQMILLSVGWLQWAWHKQDEVPRLRAAQVLDMLAHVASQRSARMAAQDWLSRSAALVRQTWPSGQAPSLSLSYFHVRGGAPRWWATSETAWAETGSAVVESAREAAAQALALLHPVDEPGVWAWPVVEDGEALGVLVALLDEPAKALPRPAATAVTLQASVAVIEPLLRRWHESERRLHEHAWLSITHGWRRLTGPGHWSWKWGSALGLAVIAALGFWPVDDLVTANTVIEGQRRQVVTSPFDGFVARVSVRPGERVREGQELARMDDRDTLLDQSAQRSARDQAAAKLRQALGDRDTGTVSQAQAELEQAEAQLHLADTKLARVALRAPMAGLVVSGDWSQKVGSPVESGKEMFEVADTEGFRVALHVPEHDIVRVQAGQTGHVRLTGYPDTSYRFQITRITATASVEEGANGFRVEAQLQGAIPPLSPGMQGVGKVEVGRTTLLMKWTRPTRDWLQLKLWSWL